MLPLLVGMATATSPEERNVGGSALAVRLTEANCIAKSAALRSDISYSSWYDSSDDNRDDNCSPNNGCYGPILGVTVPGHAFRLVLAVWGSGVRVPLAPQRKPPVKYPEGFCCTGSSEPDCLPIAIVRPFTSH